MNLQTGKREAKLLETENNTNKGSALTITENSSENTDDESSQHSRAQLEEALKNIPAEKIDNFPYSEATMKEIKDKFRSFETLKKDMEDINMGIRTDFEILSELFTQYNEIISQKDHSIEDIKEIFDTFQDLAHQIDNANEFVLSGGLEKIILPNLENSTNSELKISAIRLLGTIVQNNPKAQIAAFEKNLGQILLKSLSKSSNMDELSTLIFGLGGILRKFPIAQKEILNKPGLKLLIELLNRQVDYKVKMKCLRFISDLIQDYNEVTNVPFNGDLEKIKQYNSADIKGRLSETEYCKTIDEVFTIHRRDFLENLYTAEDILNVLMLAKDICQPVWAESPIFRHTLLVIKNNYERMKDKPELDLDSNDLENVTNTLTHLNEFLYSHIVIKDEL